MHGFKLEIAKESDKNIKHACISSHILGVYLIVTSYKHNEDAFFPCYLRNIFRSHVSNKFYRSIDCGGSNVNWPMLQIVDLASNKFTGQVQID